MAMTLQEMVLAQAEQSAARQSRLLAAFRERKVRDYVRWSAANARDELASWKQNSRAVGAVEDGARSGDAGGRSGGAEVKPEDDSESSRPVGIS